MKTQIEQIIKAPRVTGSEKTRVKDYVWTGRFHDIKHIELKYLGDYALEKPKGVHGKTWELEKMKRVYLVNDKKRRKKYIVVWWQGWPTWGGRSEQMMLVWRMKK